MEWFVVCPLLFECSEITSEIAFNQFSTKKYLRETNHCLLFEKQAPCTTPFYKSSGVE